jgi:NAD+ kinase
MTAGQGPSRDLVMVTHAGRPAALGVARSLLAEFGAAGLRVWLPAEEAAAFVPGHPDTFAAGAAPPVPVELIVVVGGDGTILRAAELALRLDVPLLGVNLGHVGFLAEVEPEQSHEVASAVVSRSLTTEERTVLDVRVERDGVLLWSTWALNEASLEKSSRERMLNVLLEVDGRPLSQWSCDGVLCATPTGSTAYAWSAGGPVVWPDVQAMVVVPLSAHALFARPLVVSPAARVSIDTRGSWIEAVVWCDGRRMTVAPPGCRVEVTTSPQRLRFARVHARPFTDRLVAKFDLPVAGWRERREQGVGGPA